MMLMLLVSTNVFAVNWVEVGSGTFDSISYVDSESIRKDGNKIRAWILVDFNSVQVDDAKRYWSVLYRVEFDCFEGTSRMIDTYKYSEKMKYGDIVFSATNLTNPATSDIPGSIGEATLKVACAKK